jgi:hypothetical protein
LWSEGVKLSHIYVWILAHYVEWCMNEWKSGRASEVDKTHLGQVRFSVSLFTKMFEFCSGSVYLIIINIK